MSKKIATLAGKSEREFKRIISKLEEMSGYPSEDVRQLAASTQVLRLKINQLGLDPDDTTPQELYHALLSRYQQDAAKLEWALGITKSSSQTERIEKASQLVKLLIGSSEAWALKNTAAKNLIKKNPPKKLMKHWHYRSVDSLLKREDVAAVFIGAELLESASWHKKLEAELAKLNTTSYELRPLKIVSFDEQKLADCTSSQLVHVSSPMAAAALCAKNPDAPVLGMALLLIDGLQNLSESTLTHRLHSTNLALNWWLDTEHLLALYDDQPVSLNFKDVAQNHLDGIDFDSRKYEAAQTTFWQQLMSRYKDHLAELPQEIARSEKSLSQAFKPALELVPDLIEMDA